ncbi:class I adenylate-forming enzyme family protein [Mycobacterium sp. CVI_P3]|uniref:Class I adenylate-forming enzyme family protein n=1 Tax=Mycobacterium pinniadriaticum TaxID=2994102 RepID=A0ABT3SF88_9MYCO|nr:class I adenylate-forming enzyme family protein [Mycobacterium pinniadriaticum]MCX2931750.1 class I adenylate-forming enzyme family protein [Mycobacterium pinniadriaticum]MCX2938175.1 class I adenylate-forming enzyme family protein [Mycobacterium pinniadriaticum]
MREHVDPPVQTVPELLRARAAAYPDTELLVTPTERLTYRQAEQRSREVARRMLTAGIGKNTRVGVLFPNSPDWIVSWLAATRIGALAIPISTYHQAPELARTLRHADVALLLMTARHLNHDYAERLERVDPALAGSEAGRLFLPALPFLREVWTCAPGGPAWMRHVDEVPADGRADDELLGQIESEVCPADPATVIYTSGSTAEPKGVVHSHGALVRHSHRVGWLAHGICAGDRIYTPNPFFWIGGLSSVLLAALHAGATVLCEPRFDPAATLRFLEREQATQFLGQKHARTALTTHPTYAERDLRSLHSLVHCTSLGMTETCGGHTAASPRAGRGGPWSPGSFGAPLPGIEHKIVEVGSDAPVSDGVSGEICVRGEDVCLGMLKRERSAVFDAEGWYHTGDWGRLDDGELFFTGRLSDTLKSSGMNVTPREVELAIEALDGVQQAMVVGIPHAERGQDVVAAVVPAAGAELDARRILDDLRRQLSSYKLPRHVSFFDRDELPTLGNGKVDRKALVALIVHAVRSR